MSVNNLIAFVLGNFGLVMFVLAVLLAALTHLLTRGKQAAAEGWFRWMVLLPFGVTGLYSFVMHAFFPAYTASVIGWANSPFQYEVAMANLAFGLMGVFSFNASFEFRLATVLGAVCWLGGDAVGHIIQMDRAHDFAPGNAGEWFWLDILIPIILVVSLYQVKKASKK